MNDASKRRMSEPAEGDGHRRVYTPEPIAEVLAYTARGKPGVDSMKSWGGSSFSLVSSLPRRAVWRWAFKKPMNLDLMKTSVMSVGQGSGRIRQWRSFAGFCAVHHRAWCAAELQWSDASDSWHQCDPPSEVSDLWLDEHRVPLAVVHSRVESKWCKFSMTSWTLADVVILDSFWMFLPQHPIHMPSLTSAALAHFPRQEPLMFTCISHATEVKSVRAFWVRGPLGNSWDGIRRSIGCCFLPTCTYIIYNMYIYIYMIFYDIHTNPMKIHPRFPELLILRFPHRPQPPCGQFRKGGLELCLRHRLRSQLLGALAEQLQQRLWGDLTMEDLQFFGRFSCICFFQRFFVNKQVFEVFFKSFWSVFKSFWGVFLVCVSFPWW